MLRAGGRLWRRSGSSRAGEGAAGAGTGAGGDRGEEPGLVRASSAEVRERLRGLALVRAGFVSEAEEEELVRELEPELARGRYQREHWDRAISWYRETERAHWAGGAGRALFPRVAAAAFPPPAPPPLPLVHVLDLHQRGHVRPHVDSVKFCGCTIAGVSLLSPSVLRLVCCRQPQHRMDLLLEPRSLYVLRGAARYEFTHEILPDAESWFGERRVPRGRRISIIFRNGPPGAAPEPLHDLPAFIADAAPQNPPCTPQ